MDILGIGPLELLFIFLIALIVLGPKDMVKAGRTLGRVMRRIVTSPSWRTLQEASKEIRYIPNRLMREAGLEEIQKELPNANQIRQEAGLDRVNKDLGSLKEDISDWTTPPTIGQPQEPKDIPVKDLSPSSENPESEISKSDV